MRRDAFAPTGGLGPSRNFFDLSDRVADVSLADQAVEVLEARLVGGGFVTAPLESIGMQSSDFGDEIKPQRHRTKRTRIGGGQQQPITSLSGILPPTRNGRNAEYSHAGD